MREEDLETDCEILWCCVNLTGTKALHVGAYYRPHEGDEESLQQLTASLERLGNRKNQTVILGGDFNFPGWDWQRNSIKSGCNYRRQHVCFKETLA